MMHQPFQYNTRFAELINLLFEVIIMDKKVNIIGFVLPLISRTSNKIYWQYFTNIFCSFYLLYRLICFNQFVVIGEMWDILFITQCLLDKKNFTWINQIYFLGIVRGEIIVRIICNSQNQLDSFEIVCYTERLCSHQLRINMLNCIFLLINYSVQQKAKKIMQKNQFCMIAFFWGGNFKVSNFDGIKFIVLLLFRLLLQVVKSYVYSLILYVQVWYRKVFIQIFTKIIFGKYFKTCCF
eukprot:TRINITY_DN5503_c1_g1_i2.p2 TRINITY_DN5503_c1_g1~~TRINITY_DN5503_c1_g1_i2.p2  ORF type:complete len:238 (-),score=-9.26 TRINITY_DN5503_c1_g1_i2:152-865(-)